MKRLLIIFVSTIFTSILFGQGEIDDQQKVFFRNERSLSLTLRTDGLDLDTGKAKESTI